MSNKDTVFNQTGKKEFSCYAFVVDKNPSGLEFYRELRGLLKKYNSKIRDGIVYSEFYHYDYNAQEHEPKEDYLVKMAELILKERKEIIE